MFVVKAEALRYAQSDSTKRFVVRIEALRYAQSDGRAVILERTTASGGSFIRKEQSFLSNFSSCEGEK